jgi:hypothetical protein
MGRAALALRLLALGLALALAPAPAGATDPLVLFLLRMLRDQVISSAIESGVEAARRKEAEAAPSAPPAVQPGAADERWLKALIDESFVHLDSAQREELYASLTRILSDPRNAAARSTILAEFTREAVAVRDAHRRLSRLSEREMREIAAEARAAFERLPGEQRRHMLEALRQGVPGMPRALNELMLAEFSSAAALR